MKILLSFMLLCMMLLPVNCFAGLHDCPNIAVLNFSKKAAVSRDLSFEDGSLVTEFVIDGLLDTDMFNIIEREQLRAITDEHSFNSTGLIDLSTATQIGKLHGVKYLVYGSVVGLSLKDKEFGYTNSKVGGVGNTQHTVIANITARFIDVETGRIVLTARGEGASTSTKTEFTFNKTKRARSAAVPSYDDYGNPINNSSDEPDETVMHTVAIGAVAVSQVQVHNALYKAADDLIYGKFGFLKKLEGKGRRKRK